jgi:hypothetical protein
MKRLPCALLVLGGLTFFTGHALAQQPPPAGPPPSIANDPPLEPGADELNAAARKGDAAAVKALLDKGIKPDAKWRYGQTALFPACDRGHIEVVRLLLERGASVTVRDSFYQATPLTWALNKGHAAVAMLLLEKGAPNSEQVLSTGITAGHAELVKLSLAKGGLRPHALTAALLQATRANKTEMVELLKAGGAVMPFDVDAATLAAYAGTFRPENPQGPTLTWVVKDGALEGGVVGNPQPLHLYATDALTFRTLEPTGIVITFAKDGSELSVLQGQQTTKFKREVKP